MMHPSTIYDMAAKAARKAARERKVPLVIEAEDIPILKTVARTGNLPRGKSIPFLGSYIPKGWRKTGQEFFVDSSGWGSIGEPALSFERFLDCVTPGLGYAVTEAGQFQVYVAEYTPPRFASRSEKEEA